MHRGLLFLGTLLALLSLAHAQCTVPITATATLIYSFTNGQQDPTNYGVYQLNFANTDPSVAAENIKFNITKLTGGGWGGPDDLSFPITWNDVILSSNYDSNSDLPLTSVWQLNIQGGVLAAGATYSGAGFIAENPNGSPIVTIDSCTAIPPFHPSSTTGSNSGCSATVTQATESTFNGGGEMSVTVTNTGTQSITGLTFSLTGSNVATYNTANDAPTSGNFQPASYDLPIPAGHTSTNIGYTYYGSIPTIALVSVSC